MFIDTVLEGMQELLVDLHSSAHICSVSLLGLGMAHNRAHNRPSSLPNDLRSRSASGHNFTRPHLCSLILLGLRMAHNRAHNRMISEASRLRVIISLVPPYKETIDWFACRSLATASDLFLYSASKTNRANASPLSIPLHLAAKEPPQDALLSKSWTFTRLQYAPLL